MRPTFFRRLLQLVEFEISSFEKQLRRLQASQFPSPIALELIDDLLTAIAAQRGAIQRIVEDFEDDPGGSGKRLRSEYRKVQASLRRLPMLENAKTDRVPWSLIPSVERQASLLLPDRKLLTTCGDCFQISWYPNPKPGLESYCVLETPSIHQSNPFINLLVAHELFHPILEDFFKTNRLEVLQRVKPKCEKLLEKHGGPDLFKEERLDEVVQEAMRYWEKAVMEVMCDLGCAAVFGPAALFAVATFAIGRDLDELPTPAGQHYPPWRYRLRAVYTLVMAGDVGRGHLANLDSMLKKSGKARYADLLNSSLKEIADEVANQSDLININSNAFLQICYEEVSLVLDAAWKFVESHAEKLGDRWTFSLGEIPRHLESLELFVPPGEYREPKDKIGRHASLAAIANASWLYRLLDDSNSDLQKPIDLGSYKRSCRLMMKAFEDVEIKRRFSTEFPNGQDTPE